MTFFSSVPFVFLFLWVFSSLCQPVGPATPYISHLSNYVSLVDAYYLSGYSVSDFIPLSDLSQTMVVSTDLGLYAINDFDEVAGNIEVVAALRMRWRDETPIINSITFNIDDQEDLLMPFNTIWTPKLVLTSATGEISDVGDSAYLCRFNMRTYDVEWKPRVVIGSACTPDVTFYPFDKQECSFTYTAWGFSDNELHLNATSDEWNLSEFEPNGEWTVGTTSTESYVQNSRSYIKFSISIIRKPLYVIFNIVLPVLLLCMLNSVVFLLPAESGERVGFSVTCFLSFVVLLNMIMDILPRSSDISLLSYYLVLMMCVSGAMTVITVLMMRVYHKPEKEQVPKWLQRCVTFINCGCARLTCCVRCFRFIKRTLGSCSSFCLNLCRGRKVKDAKTIASVSKETLYSVEVDKRTESEKTVEKTNNAPKLQDVGVCTSDKIYNGQESSFLKYLPCAGRNKSENTGSNTETKQDGEKDSQSLGKDNVKETQKEKETRTGIHRQTSEYSTTKHTLADQCGHHSREQLFTKTRTSREKQIIGSKNSEQLSESKNYDNSKRKATKKKLAKTSSLSETSQNNTDSKVTRKMEIKQDSQIIKVNSSLSIKEKYQNGEQIDAENEDSDNDSKTGNGDDVIIVTDDSDTEVDSLADLEQKVKWPEVGRVFDTFFFLGFLATEIFLTVVFLIPIATSNGGQTD